MGYYLAGFFFTFFVGLSAVSYQAIDQLVGSPSHTVNPNIEELKKIGLQYVKELNQFDQMKEEILWNPPKDLCSTLCSPSLLDKEQMQMERGFYLAQYAQKHKNQIEKDPVFRLKVRELDSLSKAFPPGARRLLEKIAQVPEDQTWQKLLLALELEYVVLSEGYRWKNHVQTLPQEQESLSQIREWIHSCQKGVPPKKIIADCQQWAGNSLDTLP